MQLSRAIAAAAVAAASFSTGAVAEQEQGRTGRTARSVQRRAPAPAPQRTWPSPPNWVDEDEEEPELDWSVGDNDEDWSDWARRNRRPAQPPASAEEPVADSQDPGEPETPVESPTPVETAPPAEEEEPETPTETAAPEETAPPEAPEESENPPNDTDATECTPVGEDETFDCIVCDDMDQFAGCILGGGTAINAGLWWKPHPLDWDDNFPEGWKASDVAAATNRVFSRIPGTTHPSMDGNLYQDEGFNVLADGLAANGWDRLETPNEHPDKKNHTFGHTTFMFSNGERGGPLATYLVTASRSPNFSLWTNTAVRRLVRDGSRVTGVELECNGATGRSGTIKVASSGRVVLSAGTFGTPKILFRSGIGPLDQLQIVQKSTVDGESMIADTDWIELPVGENLIDHLNTDVVVEHPNVYQYNYTAAWWTPDETDVELYLRDRSGILAAAAPNIGPMIWDEVELSDGSTRQLQWTCRMEGSLDYFGNHTITMSMYLGRGVVSRGRMGLTPVLTSRVITLPYLRPNSNDLEALAKGLDNVRNSLADVADLTFLSPADNITTDQYLEDYVVNVGRRSNHWMGTAKMGTDDGRENGTAVIDPDTKVYGVDNLFIVDASIFPGMVTGNPSAMIVIAAERAAERILALELPAGDDEEAPEEAPEEEAPEEEAPVEEAPDEEAPVEEAPVEDEP